MTRVLISLCSLLLFGNALAATAIVPKISGNYIFSFTKSCQSSITGNPGNSGNVNEKSGDISDGLFTVAATPDKTNYAGSLLISGYTEVGHDLYLPTDPGDLLTEKFHSNISSTYSNTANSLFIAAMNNNAGETFHVYYANIDSNNIAHNIEGISLTADLNTYTGGDPNKCTTRASLIRQ